jgi:hypothetical protein
MNNLKQLGLAMIGYAQDYDETYVPNRISGTTICSNNGDIVGWHSAIKPYVKSYSVFLCPSNPSNTQATEDVDKNFHVSYNLNGWIYNTVIGAPGPKLSTLVRPADTVMFVESTSPCGDQGDWVAEVPNGPSFYQHHGNFNGNPMGGMGNWVFFDGHGKSMKMANILKRQAASPNGWNMYGRVDPDPLVDNDLTNMSPVYQ